MLWANIVCVSMAAPTIGMPSVIPSFIATNTPTMVTIVVTISDPSVISDSVSLVRLPMGGEQPSVLGKFHDDGKNGDATAGDRVYTIQVTFNEPKRGQIPLQVSAAFRGSLKRVMSSVTTVSIQ